MAVKTLLVEDDDRIRAALRLALGEEGFEVVEASDVAEGLAAYERERPDVLLVDVMLGNSDGRDLIREVRTHSQVPIIITSARGDTTDVVAGLEAGADDYVVKPIVVKELAARIRAVRRRDTPARPEEAQSDVVVLSTGPDGLTFSENGGWLRRGADEVALTAMEFRLLVELSRHLGQMLSRPQLLERVWGYQSSGDDRLVDVTVRRLRVKIERDASQPQLLVTVRGLGYRLQGAESAVRALGTSRTRDPRVRDRRAAAVGDADDRHRRRECAVPRRPARARREPAGGGQRALRREPAHRARAPTPLRRSGRSGSAPGRTPSWSLPTDRRAPRSGWTSATFRRASSRPPRRGRPSVQLYRADGTPVVAVGVPLSDGYQYFEITELENLDTTLQTIIWAGVAAALLTTLLGAALGWWAASRVLRPLNDVAQAATRLASGDLEARAPTTTDPDLTAISSSFNAMAETLGARIRRDAEFAADVSHELRSPLTTMTASASVLESRRAELPAVAQEAVDLLVVDVARFAELLEDLLDLARDHEPFDAASQPIVDLADLAALEVEGRPHVLERRGDTRVRADSRRMGRVIANLVQNADRARWRRPAGGGRAGGGRRAAVGVRRRPWRAARGPRGGVRAVLARDVDTESRREHRDRARARPRARPCAGPRRCLLVRGRRQRRGVFRRRDAGSRVVRRRRGWWPRAASCWCR